MERRGMRDEPVFRRGATRPSMALENITPARWRSESVVQRDLGPPGRFSIATVEIKGSPSDARRIITVDPLVDCRALLDPAAATLFLGQPFLSTVRKS